MRRTSHRIGESSLTSAESCSYVAIQLVNSWPIKSSLQSKINNNEKKQIIFLNAVNRERKNRHTHTHTIVKDVEENSFFWLKDVKILLMISSRNKRS